MKIVVAGPRDYKNERLVRAYLDLHFLELEFAGKGELSILEGGATGVDTFARQWAEDNNIPHETEKAEWDKYGKRAGPYRNAIMAQKGNELVAFTTGYTPGTYNMIQQMKGMKKKVIVVPDTTNVDDILKEIEQVKEGK